MRRSSLKSAKSRKKVAEPFDKYHYYLNSVQSPEADADFISMAYRRHRKKSPITLREDFCGTYALCDRWVRVGKRHRAIGIDLDPEPLQYGRQLFYEKMSDDQRSRLAIFQANVLGKNLPSADVICALNFSYCIFHERKLLARYFTQCLRSLKRDGMLVIDVLGGSHYQLAEEEVTHFSGFKYFWEQEYFNPIDNRTKFHIHFQRRGEQKRRKVFTYDWRMWTLPELRDLLHEIGFKKTAVYWEGTKRNGEGNDIFTESTRGEECESWVAYIVALK